MLTTVIHPTIRPEKAIAAFQLWRDRAGSGHAWQYFLVLDFDGPAIQDGEGYRVIRAPGKGVVQAINHAASLVPGGIIVVATDDLEPPPDWLHSINTRMPSATIPAVLAVSDGLRKDKLLCHPILTTARLYQQGGRVFDPAFDACGGIFADNHFTARAYADDVVIEARDLVFRHNHPSLTQQGMDAAGQAQNSPENYANGLQLYRQLNPALPWGSIAVGVRKSAHDEAFFWSWTRLVESLAGSSDVVLDPATELPHAAACNLLVARFLASPADALLLVDDDMEFTPEDLAALRASDRSFDVVSALALCRRHPHSPLVLSSISPITPVDPRDFRGCVPVGFVGLAFTLVRRWVVEALVRRNVGAPFSFATGGEDGQFSLDAIALGARLSVNTDVCIGHRAKVSWYWNKQRGEPEIKEHTFGTC